ncbi:MAG: hypothetical protein IPO81_07450 [Kouleothrix sp.]|nr:hypothetical protein [Kouleothrix sp.]
MLSTLLQRNRNPLVGFLLVLVVLLGASAAPHAPAHASDEHPATAATSAAAAAATGDGATTVYMPLVANNYPWQSPLGVQADPRITGGLILTRTVDLNVGWARVAPISWRLLQPTEGGPINWGRLAGFEKEARKLKEYGIKPEVVVFDSPHWATINIPYPTSCGAIRADKLGAFAAFMSALATRYGAPEFNVHHWELGNEIDVDPRLVPPDNGYGCWGDIKDPYYGGRTYGEMLKAVVPTIRAADPLAQIWIGGLLLDNPNTTEPNRGRPELFLQGILAAGAAPYFDIVPYHAYSHYAHAVVDADLGLGGPWDSWGGLAAGKARFLRNIMQQYNVDKPLFLNETALLATDLTPCGTACPPPDAAFYEMQAMYLVRAFTRAFSEHVQAITWFTINGPGWRYSGLTDANYNPTPAYRAFQVFSSQITGAIGSPTPIDYGNGVEAYAYNKGDRQIQAVWAKQDQTLAISIPQASFVAAVDRYGNPVSAIPNGTDYVVLVRFDPIYVTVLQ